MIRTVSRGAILAVCLLAYASLAQAAQYAALVMDARTGKVIHAVNADTRVHPASLTKMMTLYIVFDEIRRGRLSLDQKITVSANAADEPPSRLGLRAGQKIELRYLIRAAAIKSANDAATAMGDYIGGSEPAFAAKMNAYARAMGMTNTTFKNANGLTRDGHMSTARDMAILGRRLVYDFPQYYNIFGRTSTSAGIATVRNTNRRLLEAYPGADGIKTGYTKAAGFNLVSSAQRGNKRVIVALLGGTSTAARNAEVARLMDLGFSEMPTTAQLAPLPPLRTTVAMAGRAAPAARRGGDRRRHRQRGRRVRRRPARLRRPSAAARQPGRVDRAEQRDHRRGHRRGERRARREPGEPQRPAAPRSQPADAAPRHHPAAAAAAAVGAGSASTFAVAAARPRPPSPRRSSRSRSRTAASATTGGNEWGVQLGAFRAKGDAERQLLTTALMDVPELNGGLRRVEAAKVQGVTVFRAQFVGLNQSDALGACEALARLQADCLPLAPGI